MNMLSAPTIFIAGITFYAGFYQLFIFLRQRTRRQDLAFALTCFATGVYDVFSAGLYSATSVAEGVNWQRGQVVSLALVAIALGWFVAEYAQVDSRRWIWVFTGYYTLAMVAGIFIRGDLTWIVSQPSIKNLVLPYGLQISYYEATPGLLTNFQSLIGIVFGFYIIGIGVRLYRQGQKSKARPLLVAMIVLFAGVINDTAVSSGLYQNIYLIEYAYLGLVLLMVYSLSGDVIGAAKAREALKESAERIRSILESIMDGITITDLKGTIIDLNEAVLQLHGYNHRDEILGRNAMELIAQEDHEKASAGFVDTLNNGRSGLIEYKFLTKEGDEFDAELNAVLLKDVHGNPSGFLALTRNITKRKQAEWELRQYADRLRILREIDRSILEAHSAEAIAVATLSHIQRLVPCQFANVIKLNIHTGHANVLAVYANGETNVRTGAMIQLSDLGINDNLLHGEILVTEDLSKIPQLPNTWHQLLTENIRGVLTAPLIAQGELIGVLNLGSEELGFFNEEQVDLVSELADVLAVAIQQAHLYEQVQSHSVALEERVHQRTAELEVKNRELETFTYSVSHDLKAPLRGIDGYSHLLQEEYADRLEGDGQIFLEAIRSGVGHMNQLIDDLLAYSRLERRAIKTGRIQMTTVLNNVITERAGELQKRGIDLQVNIPFVYVIAEMEGLTQAFRNLLDNALKFTRDIPSPRIEIGGKETKDSVVMWVRDNGIGFDMQYHDRIFEIFQRLSRAEEYPGTGIGLALVRRVMHRLHGRIWAESAPGAGATFYLEIPHEQS